MVDFDKLNKETQDYNNKNVDRFSGNNTYNKYDFDRLNNETYKTNNGVYSSKYY